MSYVTVEELAAQLGVRDTAEPRLQTCVAAATELINNTCGIDTDFDPVPAVVSNVALSVAADCWQQPDATFGIVGSGETGVVRVGRDLMARYWPQLAPYVAPDGFGVA